jgi:D-alanyl-D-alanine carboxypeptidase (penicillin-binding protein 5/6)
MVLSCQSRKMAFGLLGSAAVLSAPMAAQAEIVTTAKQAIIVDYDSGETLFCKSCDEPMPPSSMSKLMTVELVFQRLKDGRLKPDSTFHVS